jgi:hypothetical protein
MAFNVNSFSGEMSKNGIAKTSDFEVEISGAPVAGGASNSFSLNNIIDTVIQSTASAVGLGGVLGGARGVAESLSFRIDSVTMPQRSSAPLTYETYGAPYKIGGPLNYVEMDFAVICSPDLREREFFLAWQDLVGGDHRTGTTNFDIGYYDQYVCRQGVAIYQLDPNGNRTRVIKLVDSYPTLVGPIASNWSQTDVVRVNITMAYRYFIEEDVPVPLINFTAENVLSAVNSVQNLPAQIRGRSRSALDRAGIPRF